MQYSREVEEMVCVAIPESRPGADSGRGKWIQAEIKDISGYTTALAGALRSRAPVSCL